MAKTKNTPIRISNAFAADLEAGRTSLDAEGRSRSRFWSATSISCWTPVEFLVAWERSSSRGRNRGNAESRFDLPEGSGHDEPGEQGDQPDNGQIVDRHTNALRDAPPSERLDPGRIAAASTKPRNTSATTSRSFQMPTPTTAMPRMTSAQTATRRAASASSLRGGRAGPTHNCSPLTRSHGAVARPRPGAVSWVYPVQGQTPRPAPVELSSPRSPPSRVPPARHSCASCRARFGRCCQAAR